MCSCTPCIGADQSQLPTNLVVYCPHILYLRTFQRNKHRSRTAAAIDSMRVAPQKKKKNWRQKICISAAASDWRKCLSALIIFLVQASEQTSIERIYTPKCTIQSLLVCMRFVKARPYEWSLNYCKIALLCFACMYTCRGGQIFWIFWMVKRTTGAVSWQNSGL